MREPAIKKFYRINQAIRERTVRLVGPKTNEIIGLDEALQRAREAGKDLVEIAPNSDPPVAKIVDFKKFLFDEKKKERRSEKSKSVLKELRFSPVIAENDLLIRVEKAKKFLAAGNQVKITIQFRGREITHPEVGKAKLEQIKKLLEGSGKTGGEPKWMGSHLSITYISGK